MNDIFCINLLYFYGQNCIHFPIGHAYRNFLIKGSVVCSDFSQSDKWVFRSREYNNPIPIARKKWFKRLIFLMKFPSCCFLKPIHDSPQEYTCIEHIFDIFKGYIEQAQGFMPILQYI